MKDEVCANRPYPCIEVVEDAIVAFLASFSRNDALRGGATGTRRS